MKRHEKTTLEKQEEGSTKEYVDKDKKSHMLRHILQSGHPSVSLIEFKILGKGFNNNIVKRKISEVLLIKQYRPTLNTQENSISLEFFN